MQTITAEILRAVAPKFGGQLRKDQDEVIDGIAPYLTPALDKNGINTHLRIAHFLAQTCHESAGFRTLEEFASGEAYEGRRDLGNTERGDGRRFKGRGIIQITGRENYRLCGRDLRLPLLDNPELAAQPKNAVDIAVWYWERKGLNKLADRDDVRTITYRINGGYNGYADRKLRLRKAKEALLAAQYKPATQFLRRGSKGEGVASVQSALRDRGYLIAIDGDFGPATELAVRQWQSYKGLLPDGVVGPRTWATLEKRA